MIFASQVALDSDKLGSALRSISDTLFNGQSLLVLLICLVSAAILSSLISRLLRKLSHMLRRSSQESKSRTSAARFRRLETLVVLSIAVVKLALFVLAFYVWWIVTHPSDGQPTFLLGASAFIAIVVGGVVGPLLRDFAYGSSMMAEQWYAVGDLVTIEPFSDMRGVVERITLRSTRIRGLNGEIIWISNQSIAAVRVARKGVSTVAIELFVTSVDEARQLIEEVNNLLPTGKALLAEKLSVIQESERAGGVWHVTAIGETAPAREWILQETALDLIKKLDESRDDPILVADPVARFADSETERGFELAVANAKKKQVKFDYKNMMARRRTQAQSVKEDKKTVKSH